MFDVDVSLMLEVCSILQFRNSNDPFLNRIVISDRKWILYENRKRSAQWPDPDASNTSQIQNCGDSRGSPLALFMIDFWNPTRASEPKFTSNNRMNFLFS